MKPVEFTKAFVGLTQRQQQVLLKVLAGAKDADIAQELRIKKDTVRKHVENICKTFGLSQGQDAGFSHRPELIALFATHRPELFGNRPAQTTTQIVLSYHRSQEPDQSFIASLDAALKKQGYGVFLASSSLRMADNGLQKICVALNQCDYFLLILSPLSACSEMVTEEVRLAKTLRDNDPHSQPTILPITFDCPLNLLNHDLRGYLKNIPLQRWNSPEDTKGIIANIFATINSGQPYEEVPTKRTPVNTYAATPNYPPQPVAEPELPRGQVELASAFYVERSGIDQRCYEAINKPGALIRIKAPRQMGKTSLLARILHHASQQDCVTVPLSFQLADSNIFQDLERFLKWFSANIALQLELPDRLADHWNTIFGSKVACKSYFERYLLSETPKPLVLGLDEVDVVFRYPEIAADFFGLLRAWHEEAKNREIWKKLRLVVVHSTEVYVPLDINQSPFNVGLPIELPEFSPTTVQELAQRHGLAWGMEKVNQLMNMVGGHPYLIRLALYKIARQEITLTKLLATAPTDAGLYSDHLRRHLWNLEQHSELAAAIKIVVNSNLPVQLESMQGFKLHSLGLVNLQGNQVTPRCNLYRQYFQVRLES